MYHVLSYFTDKRLYFRLCHQIGAFSIIENREELPTLQSILDKKGIDFFVFDDNSFPVWDMDNTSPCDMAIFLYRAILIGRRDSYDFQREVMAGMNFIPYDGDFIITRKFLETIKRIEEYSRPIKTRFCKMFEAVCKSEEKVLILGESGAGKSFTASEIHKHSIRKEKEFRKFPNDKMVRERFVSELYGTVKGSYTGDPGTPGMLSVTKGGSILFEQIDLMPDYCQGVLNVLIDEKQYSLQGSNESVVLDTRMMFATSEDPKLLMDNNRMRFDFYSRISGLSITVPPLRDHIDDVPRLAKKMAYELHMKISDEAIMKLMTNPWPANVRGLKDCIMRAKSVCRGREIRAEDIEFSSYPMEISKNLLPPGWPFVTLH